MRVAVVGGGIAGASAAAFLAAGGANVTLVEREPTLAYHTTGRSAAQWIENLGHPAIRTLTSASKPFFDSPPEGAADGPLLTERPIMMVARHGQEAEFDLHFAAGQGSNPPARQVSAAEAAGLCPLVDPETVALAMIEDGSMDIDVGALHQAYVRMLRAHGGTIATSTRVDSARPSGSGWAVETTAGTVQADVVVNAAGAWGDFVAQSAGVRPIGLEPRRRTAFMVPISALPNAVAAESHRWPMLVNVDHDWYVKPDGAQFLCSPADQTPSVAMDAKPEEVDIAQAIEQINAETRLQIRSVASSWAGLRTFARDESLVLGPDPDQPTFIWCVGQGGIGIQTSPAAGQLVADLTLGTDVGGAYDLDRLLPNRLRNNS